MFTKVCRCLALTLVFAVCTSAGGRADDQAEAAERRQAAVDMASEIGGRHAQMLVGMLEMWGKLLGNMDVSMDKVFDGMAQQANNMAQQANNMAQQANKMAPELKGLVSKVADEAANLNMQDLMSKMISEEGSRSALMDLMIKMMGSSVARDGMSNILGGLFKIAAQGGAAGLQNIMGEKGGLNNILETVAKSDGMAGLLGEKGGLANIFEAVAKSDGLAGLMGEKGGLGNILEAALKSDEMTKMLKTAGETISKVKDAYLENMEKKEEL